LDFKSLTEYLDECLIFGIKPSLIRIDKILQLLGDPHKKLDFIHIVGSNGKTSTTKLLSSILYESGVLTGYHISPHITSYTERIWLNGRDISSDDFLASYERIKGSIEEVNSLDMGGPMTQFEIIAAMAFEIASFNKLDVMVLEAGMGGRWDATNAADSMIAGLTGVSLEHTDILGDTIEKIAMEKVQVIKEGAKAVTTSRDPEVLKVLRSRISDVKDTSLYSYGKDFLITEKEDLGLEGFKLDIKGVLGDYSDINLPLLGDYQPLNLALAITISELYLSGRGISLKKENIDSALEKVTIKGRFEILKEGPRVIADASHNLEGIEHFSQNIQRYFKDRKKIIIFSVLSDKDYLRMIGKVIGISDVLILTSSGDQRSLDIDSLEETTLKVIAKTGKEGKIPEKVFKIDNIDNSLNFALNMADINDIICITGSITNLEHVY